MKLLIATDIFPPQVGGPATYVVALANASVERGDEVKIVSLNPESDVSCVSCIMYHVSWRWKLMRYLQYFYLLFKHAKDVDIIYAMGPVNAGLPALITAKLRRKKFVVKVVGDYAWEQWENQKSKIKNQNFEFVPLEDFAKQKVNLKIKILKCVERLVARKADMVIVPSEYLKKIVVGWGAKTEKTEVIHNEAELIDVPSIKHEGEKWLVSVGRLVPWKGFDTLIEVMSELVSCHSRESGNPEKIKLKIVGNGPQFVNLQSKIKNLKLENVVELLGELSHDETLSYIKSADVFVLNSGYEGLSHVILEALSFNRPVLASNSGGNPELLSAENLFAYNNKKEILEKIEKILCVS